MKWFLCLVVLLAMPPAANAADDGDRTLVVQISPNPPEPETGGLVLLVENSKVVSVKIPLPWPNEIVFGRPPAGRLKLVLAPDFGNVDSGTLLEQEVDVLESGTTRVTLTPPRVKSKQITIQLSSSYGAPLHKGDEVRIEDVTNGHLPRYPNQRFLSAETLDNDDGKVRFKGFVGRTYRLFTCLPYKVVFSEDIRPTETGPNTFTWNIDASRRVRLKALWKDGPRRVPFTDLTSLCVDGDNGGSGGTYTVVGGCTDVYPDSGGLSGCKSIIVRPNSQKMQVVEGATIRLTEKGEQTYEVVFGPPGAVTNQMPVATGDGAVASRCEEQNGSASGATPSPATSLPGNSGPPPPTIVLTTTVVLLLVFVGGALILIRRRR
jgi:hypothetical protein